LHPGIALPSPHLEELLGRIRPAVEATERESSRESENFERDATIKNIHRSMRLILEQSSIIRTLVEAGKLSVEGAILDIHSGKVSFLT
jgi:carbonic anhydrase